MSNHSQLFVRLGILLLYFTVPFIKTANLIYYNIMLYCLDIKIFILKCITVFVIVEMITHSTNFKISIDY